VRMMVLSMVPTADYLDEELTLAICHAADQKVRVISVSIGKSTALRPELINAAVQYAMDKCVLIVHVVGKLGKLLSMDLSKEVVSELRQTKGWVEVGASVMKDDANLLFRLLITRKRWCTYSPREGLSFLCSG
jgi:hypothetical protein